MKVVTQGNQELIYYTDSPKQKIYVRYAVVQTVSYLDPMLGTFVIEKGDILEQCIDSPGYYSNGLAMVTIHNILHRVPEFFVPIIPKLKVQVIKKSTYNTENTRLFLEKFCELSNKTYKLLYNRDQPILVSIGGKFPRKLKKKLKKLGLI